MTTEERARVSRVAICVATCRRPEGLRRLVEGLGTLAFRGEAPRMRLIVVDNDPLTSGHEVRNLLRELAPNLSAEVQLVSEPERGITYARNAALEYLEPGEWVVFVDDDEVPDPYWLDELIAVQQSTGADIVTGPVLPDFVETPPQWALDGGFFDRQRYETGTVLGVAYTGNVMLSAAAAATRFDDAFALSGGSDSHYFRRLNREGFDIVWADAALIYESVPPSRVTIEAIMRRSYRVGNGLCRIALEAEPGPSTAFVSLIRALSRLVRGSGQLLIFAFGPAFRRVRALDTIASGAGRVAALLGGAPTPYDRIHGV